MDERNEFEKLENALTRTGKSIAYPATPALAARVQSRLESRTRPTFGLPRRALIALTALLVALALLVAIPETREALAQILGLRTIRIIPVTPTLTSPPTPLPSTSSGQALKGEGSRIQCCVTTLADAQARSRFRILLPPNQTASKVYLQTIPAFGSGAQQIILVFGDPNAPNFVLYQATNFLYGKLVSGGTAIGEATVNRQRALWFTGLPHVLVYLDANGNVQFESERVVNLNTLVWESGEVTYRVETPLSKEDAIRFAESLQ